MAALPPEKRSNESLNIAVEFAPSLYQPSAAVSCQSCSACFACSLSQSRVAVDPVVVLLRREDARRRSPTGRTRCRGPPCCRARSTTCRWPRGSPRTPRRARPTSWAGSRRRGRPLRRSPCCSRSGSPAGTSAPSTSRRPAWNAGQPARVSSRSASSSVMGMSMVGARLQLRAAVEEGEVGARARLDRACRAACSTDRRAGRRSRPRRPGDFSLNAASTSSS